jgi:hypothetical protein
VRNKNELAKIIKNELNLNLKGSTPKSLGRKGMEWAMVGWIG